MRLFTYGSLMYPNVMYQVLGIQLKFELATLYGYQRGMLIGSLYPALFKVANNVVRNQAAVHGKLYQYLSRSQFRKLLVYEGKLYKPVKVTVVTASGDKFGAMVFISRPGLGFRFISNVATISKNTQRVKVDH